MQAYGHLLAGCILVATMFQAWHVRAAEPRPNVIFILCDNLGYGDVGCFGNRLHRTPNLDRMAAEGLRLTHHYSASGVCSPSRAALMTGCYPIRIGLEKGSDGLVLR